MRQNLLPIIFVAALLMVALKDYSGPGSTVILASTQQTQDWICGQSASMCVNTSSCAVETYGNTFTTCYFFWVDSDLAVSSTGMQSTSIEGSTVTCLVDTTGGNNVTAGDLKACFADSGKDAACAYYSVYGGAAHLNNCNAYSDTQEGGGTMPSQPAGELPNYVPDFAVDRVQFKTGVDSMITMIGNLINNILAFFQGIFSGI